MDVKIQAINFDATDKLKAFINKKAERVQRHSPAITSVDVKLTVVKPETALNKEAVVKVLQPQEEMVADTFEEAIDLCLEAIEKQLEKKKGTK